MNKEPRGKNVGERGSRFFRNLHIALGAVALAATPFVGPAYEALATTVAIFEFAHAAVWEGLRRVISGRKASPAPA